MLKTFKKEYGFTLIEIIAILVVLGILVATAVSRSTNFDAEVYTGADALKNHLRYAQTMAMNEGETSSVWGISCDASQKKYWLFQGDDPTKNHIRLPDDEQFIDNRTISLERKKIRVEEGFTIFFDNYGIPYSAYPNEPLTTVPLHITVRGGSSSKDIKVHPRTGFIP